MIWLRNGQLRSESRYRQDKHFFATPDAVLGPLRLLPLSTGNVKLLIRHCHFVPWLRGPERVENSYSVSVLYVFHFEEECPLFHNVKVVTCSCRCVLAGDCSLERFLVADCYVVCCHLCLRSDKIFRTKNLFLISYN